MDSGERETIARRALARAGKAAEVIVYDEGEGLTRFTHDVVHQNLDRSLRAIVVRAIVGDRSGIASTTSIDDRGLADVAERALRLASVAPPDPRRARLSDASSFPPASGAFTSATANATPDERAHHVAQIFQTADESELWSAGYVRTARSGVTIANTQGLRASFDTTEAAINVKMNATDATGYAEQIAVDVGALSGRDVAERAAAKARDGRAPAGVEPGKWTVILEPAAFGELLAYWLPHFSAQAYHDGTSFLSGGGFERRFARGLTLYDDVRHPLHPGMPFDFEGTPTQRVGLVESGVPQGVVTDRYWSEELGCGNTGHALPPPNTAGPQAMHVVVAPGEATASDLIASTERGLLISRFWYIRVVDPRRAIVTGMTRDGTFLIENGAITRGVRNLRFNESILETLSSATFASDLTRTGGYSYGLVVPAVKLDAFTFTSTTEF